MVSTPSPAPADQLAFDLDAERRTLVAALAPAVRTLVTSQVATGPDAGGFDPNGVGFACGRHAGFSLPLLVAALPHAADVGVTEADLLYAIRAAATFLLRRQDSEGRLDLSGLYSPNEVGFTLPALVSSIERLERRGDATDIVRDLDTFVQRGAEAVLNGAAYTANHRWAAACAPLAAALARRDDPRYHAAIAAYLADGIDCDEQGCWYEERSPNYNGVANLGLMVLADRLGRSDLLAHVVASGNFVLAMRQPNGEQDSSFSFRQDRGAFGRSLLAYPIARRCAQLSGDGRFTTVCQDILARGGEVHHLAPVLFECEDHPAPLPAPLPLYDDSDIAVPSIALHRRRRGMTALTLSADPGGHYFDTVRDQWGGAKRNDDWFHLHHHDLVIQSLHLAGANMQNVQPGTVRVDGDDAWRLDADQPGWTHSLNFRPGSPTHRMRWDWRTQIAVAWQGDRITLAFDSTTPHSLYAVLRWWVRPGTTVCEGDGASRQLAAGESLALAGGMPVRLAAGRGTATVTGLPPAEHRIGLRHAPAIPSGLLTTCASIWLGVRFPVALRLALQLH